MHTVVTRRTVLAMLAAAGTISGCASPRHPAPGPGARLTTASPITTLNLAVDWEGASSVAARAPTIVQEILAPFEQTHPGLRVAVTLGPGSNGPNNSCADCNMGSLLASLLAGKGPDVFSTSSNTMPLITRGFLAPLSPYLHQFNVPLTTWSPRVLARGQYGGELFVLPSEAQTFALACNEDVLNTLGLSVPAPSWNQAEALQTWLATSHSSSGPNGLVRYGIASSWLAPMSNTSWSWLVEGFGGHTHDPAGTQATFTSAGALAAGRWVDLVHRYAKLSGANLYNATGMFASGQAAFMEAPSWSLPAAAALLNHQVKWRFLPYPTFPHGPASPLWGNHYGMSSTTAHPDAAWALLHWICVDSAYWKREVRVTLNTPAQTNLWSEWQAVVESVAPPLKGKGLHWFSDPIVRNYAIAGTPFVLESIGVDGVIRKWSSQLWSGRVSVTTAFQGIDQQVNALEAAALGAGLLSSGPAALDAAVAVRRQLAHAGTAGHAQPFSAPPSTGPGVVAAPNGDFHEHAGRVTLVGVGSGVGGLTDSAVFAATTGLAATANYSARLTAFGPTGSVALRRGASTGLMVRGDLAGSAAMACVLVGAGAGVMVGYRQTEGVPVQWFGRPQLAQAALLAPSAITAANYLKNPVWFRAQRRVGAWTFSISMDGVKWAVLGKPVSLDIAGAYVGLFAASGAGRAYDRVTSVFDHLVGLGPKQAWLLK